ncbi:hypothetical protein FKM82_012077 [Ascaphus truei]
MYKKERKKNTSWSATAESYNQKQRGLSHPFGIEEVNCGYDAAATPPSQISHSPPLATVTSSWSPCRPPRTSAPRSEAANNRPHRTCPRTAPSNRPGAERRRR